MSRRKEPRPLAEDTEFGDGRLVLPILTAALGQSPDRVDVLNHRGLLSLYVELQGHRYKVAECESETRAGLAETALNAVLTANGPVPRLLARDGAVLIADWAEGKPCRDEPFPRQKEVLLACQSSLYETAIPDEAPAVYVHLETLVRRFRSMGTKIASEAQVERVIAGLWGKLPAPDKPRVIHPDLTPANVVIGPEGPVIIDNEAMAVGCGIEFDVWNSGEALCGHRRLECIRSYVSAFDERCTHERLFEYEQVWNAFRLLRRMLKSIEKRRLIKARWLLRRLSRFALN